MAKKQTAESDESRLKKKIAQKLANQSNPEGDASHAVFAQAVEARATQTAGIGPETEACRRE